MRGFTGGAIIRSLVNLVGWGTKVLYYILRPFFWVFFRTIIAVLGGLRVENADRVPRRGGVIVAPNHISFADPPVVAVCLKRYAWFLATDEMFQIPVMGTLAKIMRALPIRQDSPDRSALRRTLDLLKGGEAVVIFPEGHVSKDGRLQPIQAGTILLAIQAGVPIVPVGVVATDRMMPPHQWKLHHAGRRMTVRFGAPIPVDELAGGLKGRAALDHGVEVLRAAITALSEQPAPSEVVEEPVRRENRATVAEQSKLRV
jgi:1-acyl-sn-glycerol-3-phosphate acyltransferase